MPSLLTSPATRPRSTTCKQRITQAEIGGSLCRQKIIFNLKANENIAFTAMKGEDTLSCVAVSVQGKAKEIGPEKLPGLFRKNPYMEKIYPDVRSRSALTVFKIYEGTGEWFDLSKQPIERASFSFGGAQAKKTGYFVTAGCIGCKLCYSKCPQKCIDISTKPAIIQQEHCLHCGNCYEICPARAIERR